MDWNGIGEVPEKLAEEWCRLAELDSNAPSPNSWHPSLDVLPGSNYDNMKKEILAEVSTMIKDFKKDIKKLILESNSKAVDAIITEVNIPEHVKAEVQIAMACECGGSKLGLPHSKWCGRS